MDSYSRVPFHLKRKHAWICLVLFSALDLLFVLVYLISRLPEIRGLTVSQTLNCLNLDAEANFPTNYAILKLYFSSLMSFLMIFWHDPERKSPLFWKIATVTLFAMGLDESAQIHEVWGAGVSVKLFGDLLTGNQYTIFPYALLLGAFYLSSLTLFPKHSRPVFAFFVLSGVFFILSQAAEWSFGPAMDLMYRSFEAFGSLAERFTEYHLMIAWEEGLEMIGYPLMAGGIVWGISDIQRESAAKAA